MCVVKDIFEKSKTSQNRVISDLNNCQKSRTRPISKLRTKTYIYDDTGSACSASIKYIHNDTHELFRVNPDRMRTYEDRERENFLFLIFGEKGPVDID